jgi:hypothetical protein
MLLSSTVSGIMLPQGESSKSECLSPPIRPKLQEEASRPGFGLPVELDGRKVLLPRPGSKLVVVLRAGGLRRES